MMSWLNSNQLYDYKLDMEKIRYEVYKINSQM